jgi:hypothetical protein
MWSSRTLHLALLTFILTWHSYARAKAQHTWRGFIVRHPESISGAWEAREGSSFIGLQIHLMTEVKGMPRTLHGVDQTFLAADIEVYERNTPERKIGEGNWYQDNSPGVDWSGFHLTIRPTNATIKPIVSVDLTLNSASETWTGHYRRGSVDHDVVLTRPSRDRNDVLSPFVGTWRRSTPGNNCLHITQAECGALVAWSDDLMAPGDMRYANGLRPPDRTLEQFGSIAQIATPSARSVVVELKALSAGCCSIFTGGKLADDSLSIQSYAGSRTTTRVISGFWTRVRANSCIESKR